jgi:hypothetical protein
LSGSSGPLGGTRAGHGGAEIVDATPSGVLVRAAGTIVVLRDRLHAWLNYAGTAADWVDLSSLGLLGPYSDDLLILAAARVDILLATAHVLASVKARAVVSLPANLSNPPGNNDGYDFPTGAGTETIRIEYQVDATYVATPGAVTVDERGAADWQTWRDRLNAAIAAHTTATLVDEISGGQVYQGVWEWPVVGVAGNVPVVQTFPLLGHASWFVLGFTGGREALDLLAPIVARLLALLAANPDLTAARDLLLARDIVGEVGASHSLRAPNAAAGTAGDTVALLGGNATGPGDHNGGNVQLDPGAGVGAGSDGLLYLAGTAFTAAEIAALYALLSAPPGGITSAIARETILTTGTAATHNFLAGIKAARVRMVGGGGGGASASANAGEVSAAGGGAAGSYSESLLTTDLTMPLTYTVGAGGATVPGGANALPGGDTSVTLNGVTRTAAGGSGGLTMVSGTTPAFTEPAAWGWPSTGDIVKHGDPGGAGIRLSDTVGCSGRGGSSPFGTGGSGAAHATAANGPAGRWGAGSDGATAIGAGSPNGAAGLGGVIIITEYY